MLLSPQAFAAFIVFIGILIFVHELGHFLVAKLFNIKVVKFSLGFGPTLLSFTAGETTYQIAAIPLGGYVKMVGDSPYEDLDPKDEPRAFTRAPVYQRALVAVAGPMFNFIFPVVCFFAYNLLGPEVLAPEVGSVEPGQPAATAGLRAGDRIVSIDGYRTWSFGRLVELIQDRPNTPTKVEVERGPQTVVLEVTPEAREDRGPFGQPREIGIIGVASRRTGTRLGVVDAAQVPDGLQTGDQVLRVGDTRVNDLVELEAALQKAAGADVELHILRSVTLAAGAVLSGQKPDLRTVSVKVPQAYVGLSSIGLASSETFVRNVVPDGAADRVGIRPHDQIVAVNDKAIHHFWALRLALGRGDDPVSVTYRRDGETKTVTLKNDPVPCYNEMTAQNEVRYVPGFGVRPSGTAERKVDCDRLTYSEAVLANWDSSAPARIIQPRLTIAEAAVESVRQTFAVIGIMTKGLYMLFSGKISTNNVGGPLSMFGAAAAAAEQGLLAYLKMLALISVNLGLLNLLPIPILDGGHLLFCAIEAIRREPISLRTKEIASMVGLVLLVAVLLLAVRNDIIRYVFS